MSSTKRFGPVCAIGDTVHGVMIEFAAPDGWWGQPLMRQFGKLEAWFLQIFPTADGACTQLVRLQGKEANRALDWLAAADPRALVMARQPSRAVVRVVSFDCPLGRLAAKARVAPHFPFLAQGGTISWLVLEQPEATRGLLDCLDQAGLEPRIVRSGEWSPVPDELTMHQRGVLAAAMESGFYDAPRRITLTALARRLGVSKSTLSETLIAIESRVMQARLGNNVASPGIRPVRLRN